MYYTREIDNSTLIQFIILYTLLTANKLVAYDDLLNLVLNNCNINYNDFQISLDNLIRTKHAEAFITGKNIQKFRITDKGRGLADFIKGKIPIYVRRPIEDSIKKLLLSEHIRAGARGKVTPAGNNKYNAECELYNDKNERLISVSLPAESYVKANKIVDYFKRHADTVYVKILDAFSLGNV